MAFEEMAIARAIHEHGAEAVELSLLGAREQRKSDDYDPSDWVNLQRYLEPKAMGTLVNLGARARNRQRRLEAQKLQQAQLVESEPAPDELIHDPEKIKRILGGLMK